jgi:hypothetical protein
VEAGDLFEARMVSGDAVLTGATYSSGEQALAFLDQQRALIEALQAG